MEATQGSLSDCCRPCHLSCPVRVSFLSLEHGKLTPSWGLCTCSALAWSAHLAGSLGSQCACHLLREAFLNPSL